MRVTARLGRLVTAAAAALGLTLAAAAATVAPASAAPAASATVTTVVSGLDNPRDLAFSPDGRLYVAEAGHGGLPSDCVPGGPEGGSICPGFTSGVSVINLGDRRARRVISGLASLSDVGGFSAVGLDGISFLGDGTLYGIMAESRDAVPPGAFRPALAERLKAQLGRLIKVSPSGRLTVVADVGHRDFVWSGNHKDLAPNDFPDANPYGVLALPGVRWVVDAGANTIDQVTPDGRVSVAAFFPNPPVGDAVPTCVDRGPDGALYVGELTAAGNAPGTATVWRFRPGDHAPTVWATGLTAVTGCGFGADGHFYAVEFSTLGLINAAPGTGAVVRVAPHSSAPRTVVSGLSFPGGFAARDGSLFVSNWSVAPANSGGGPTGQVVRIDLGH